MDSSQMGELLLTIVLALLSALTTQQLSKKNKMGEFKKRLFNGDSTELTGEKTPERNEAVALTLAQSESSKRIDTLEALIERVEKTLSDKIEAVGTNVRSMVDSVLITNSRQKTATNERFESLENRMKKTEEDIQTLKTQHETSNETLQKISDDISRLIAMVEKPGAKLGTSEMKALQVSAQPEVGQ